MKRYEFGIDPFPESPLIGLAINQCESQFDDDNWHHVAFCKSGNNMKLFVN